MNQKLAVKSIDGVKSVEPGIFEITVGLEDGTKASLRMNVFVLRSLIKAIKAEDAS